MLNISKSKHFYYSIFSPLKILQNLVTMDEQKTIVITWNKSWASCVKRTYFSSFPTPSSTHILHHHFSNNCHLLKFPSNQSLGIVQVWWNKTKFQNSGFYMFVSMFSNTAHMVQHKNLLIFWNSLRKSPCSLMKKIVIHKNFWQVNGNPISRPHWLSYCFPRF